MPKDLNDLLQLGPINFDELLAKAKPIRVQKRDNDKPTSAINDSLDAVERDNDISGAVGYNEFTARVEAKYPLPWSAPHEQFPRPWQDSDDTFLAAYLQQAHQISIGVTTAANVIRAAADHHRFHPVREFLIRCRDQWDGQQRIHKLFSEYIQCEQPREYTEPVSRVFLISAVARIMSPGCQVDTMPVLAGPQGVGKSTAFRVIFDPWFTDDLGAPGTKDAVEQLRGVWCVEFCELKQFDRASVLDIKSFLSRRVDRFRPSYGRNVVDYPRQNIFVATTNVYDWQRDETGARRYFPLTVRRRIDIDTLAACKEQLLGEALKLYNNGERWYFSEPPAYLRQAHEECREADVLESRVAQYLNMRESVTIAEILSDCFELDKQHWDQRAQNRAARMLRAIGWVRYQQRGKDGTRAWMYRREQGPAPAPEPRPPAW